MAWLLGSAEQEAPPSHERGWVRLGISELMKFKLCPGRIAESSQVLAERRDGGSVSVCPEVCVSGTWTRKYKWLLNTGVLGQKGDFNFEELGRETELIRKYLVCNPKKVRLYPEGNGKSSEELL